MHQIARKSQTRCNTWRTIHRVTSKNLTHCYDQHHVMFEDDLNELWGRKLNGRISGRTRRLQTILSATAGFMGGSFIALVLCKGTGGEGGGHFPLRSSSADILGSLTATWCCCCCFFSSLARIFGECSTIHSPPALFTDLPSGIKSLIRCRFGLSFGGVFIANSTALLVNQLSHLAVLGRKKYYFAPSLIGLVFPWRKVALCDLAEQCRFCRGHHCPGETCLPE